MSSTTIVARDPAVETPHEQGRVRPAAAEAPARGRARCGALAFPVLLVLGALDAAGYSILAPVLPTIATTTGAGPASIGLLVASFPGALLAGIAVAGARLRRTPTATMQLAALALLGLGIAEGILPLRLAVHLDQARIGAVYGVIAVLVAGSAAVAGTVRPRAALTVGSVLVVAGIGLAGAAGGLGWLVVGLAVAGIGVGLGETGATGVLLDTVAPERIVTAMVVWSQLGIVGYLAGPALGGAAAQALGFGALGSIPLAAATAVAVGLRLTSNARPPTSEEPAAGSRWTQPPDGAAPEPRPGCSAAGFNVPGRAVEAPSRPTSGRDWRRPRRPARSGSGPPGCAADRS